jgi:hypothetical protein
MPALSAEAGVCLGQIVNHQVARPHYSSPPQYRPALHAASHEPGHTIVDSHGDFFLPLVIIEKPNLRDSSPGTAILSAPGLHLSRHIHHAPPTASPRLFQSSLIRLAPPPTTAHDRHSPSDA